jgi:hypothetical protein
MMKFVTAALISATILLSLPLPAPAAEELGRYSVRWVHGGKTDFGTLRITDNDIIFEGDAGEIRHLPFIWIDEVLIVEDQWIQVRANVETGVSLGLNDVYNFGVVGGKPDPQLIATVNKLLLEKKEERLERMAKLPGEHSRYMASKAERIGDDIGLLIITETKIIFRSDTGGKDHEWTYADVKGVELIKPDLIKVQTDERSILKFGGRRAYRFVSSTGPFRPDDLAFIITKIAEAKETQQ